MRPWREFEIFVSIGLNPYTHKDIYHYSSSDLVLFIKEEEREITMKRETKLSSKGKRYFYKKKKKKLSKLLLSVTITACSQSGFCRLFNSLHSCHQNRLIYTQDSSYQVVGGVATQCDLLCRSHLSPREKKRRNN